MTFSILAKDAETGAIGGAAATGSLCVGGWVLRGDARFGMSASQGASPSTLWGEDVLKVMSESRSAVQAVGQVTGADRGREFRQLAAIDLNGRTAGFTGDRNVPEKGVVELHDGIASCYLLSNRAVLDELATVFQSSALSFPERLLAALTAAEDAGGDSRGLNSAALLVVTTRSSPLTLRVDYSEDPIEDLKMLLRRSQQVEYANWASQVPTLENPERTLD